MQLISFNQYKNTKPKGKLNRKKVAIIITIVMASMKSGTTPQVVFQGVLQGLNGSEERVVYRECIPSGDIDLQNVANGDVIKRNWDIFVNGKPDLQ